MAGVTGGVAQFLVVRRQPFTEHFELGIFRRSESFWPAAFEMELFGDSFFGVRQDSGWRELFARAGFARRASAELFALRGFIHG